MRGDDGLGAGGYAAFGAVCALRDIPVFSRGADPAPAGWGWAVAAVGGPAALGCAAMARYGPRPVPRVLLWIACGLAMVAAFGLLIDVITLIFGEGVDSWAAAANHALAATGAVLLVTTTRSAAGRPDHCEPAPSSVSAPARASRPARIAAYVRAGSR